ncbi:phosphoenolpyruvate-utilizing N-terminal domain-containing protein, partial [Clavibacter michiganensis]|uniref:phosphoenolpyruvate-utilizing N-terminal domain-containing protein n=1 Tax=Clavibacter michiganensis TaxID=28447 RepID=UPI00263B15F4
MATRADDVRPRVTHPSEGVPVRITGIGVGHGVATGPVIRMPDPLPEPGTEPFAGDAEAEVARVADALAATADDLAER